MKKTSFRKGFAVFFTLTLLLTVALLPMNTAVAFTYGYADGSYDFGAPVFVLDSGGTGYMALGDKFKLPNTAQCITAPSLSGSGADTALMYFEGNFQLFANGGACQYFTFKDLGFCGSSIGMTFTSARLVLKDRYGVTLTDTALGNSLFISTNSISNLSSLYNLSPWNVDSVSEVDFTFSLSNNDPSTLNFENITLANVNKLTPTGITTSGVTGTITPVAGETPATYTALTSVNATQYSVTGLTWLNTDNTNATLVNGKFKAETPYKASVELTAATGYTFVNLTPPTLNGVSGNGFYISGSGEGNKLVFTYPFPATANLSVTGIAVQTQPTNMNYIEGQALNLTGLVARLTYNDTSTEDVSLTDFASKAIAVNPANGTTLNIAEHNNAKVTLSCNGKTAQTDALTVLTATYTVTADPTTKDFGSAIEGYSTLPMPQTVTITNAGNSTVILTQPTATDYIVGTLTTTSVAPGSSATFTVQPKPGLSVGEHDETITISTNHSTSATVDASFSVGAATYAVTADPLTKDFGSAIEGYATLPAAQTVTITNAGNSTVTLAQPTAINYTVGTLSTASVAPGGSATFTVQPKPGLSVGEHDETITISTNRSTNATVDVKFSVGAATYTVTADPLTKDFGSAIDGYATLPTAQTVTITNTGNSAVTLTQPTAMDYTVGTLSTASVAPGGTATFTVQPKPGLSVGEHNETIIVNTNHITSAIVDVSFSVGAATYTVITNLTAKDFGDVIEGYATLPAAQTVTITNVGNSAVTLTQPTATDYTVGTLSTASVAPGGTATFTVQPKAGLSIGEYDETITVSTNHSTNATVDVSFSVGAATYTVTADPTVKDFGSAIDGYATLPAAQTVTITNTGNSALTLTQPTATDYTVGTLSTASVAPGGTATFTVQPKAGLSIGEHDETITVSTSHSTSVGVGVSFTVDPQTIYAISLSPTTLSFGSLAYPYLQPGAQSVTVTNSGNQNLTLFQPTSAHYTIGALTTMTLSPGAQATFTVTPKSGLSVGTWDETIQVYASNSTDNQLSVSFACTAGTAYSILSGDGSVFQNNGAGTVTITANGNLSRFTGLTVNGSALNAGSYDAASGSTVITLHQDYLNTLSPGTYTLGFHYTDGYAEARFVVQDPVAVTGDNQDLLLFGALAALSLAALLLMRKKTARR